MFLVGFIFTQSWGPVSYFAMPLLPITILEFFVFPFLPYLDVPPIPFEAWVESENGSSVYEKTDYAQQKDEQNEKSSNVINDNFDK